MADDILSPRQVLESFDQRVTDAVRKSLEDNDRVANGKLYGTIIAITKVYGQKVVMELHMEDYGKFVNEGVNGTQQQRGSKFSFKKKNLKQGVMLKHIADRGERLNPIVNDISKHYKNKKGILKTRKKPLPLDKARRSLAFIMGRNIAKKGIAPTHFVEEGFSGGILQDLEKALLDAVGREIKIEVEGVYTKR
jgi:hypothetical protein